MLCCILSRLWILMSSLVLVVVVGFFFGFLVGVFLCVLMCVLNVFIGRMNMK